MGRITEQRQFTAADTFTALGFSSMDAGWFDPALDNVVVTQMGVPLSRLRARSSSVLLASGRSTDSA